jgi:hypothetical protein
MRPIHFWAVLFASLLGYTSGFGPRNLWVDGLRLRFPSLTFVATNGDDPGGEHSFILPVFPLRKSVRLPTETLTLNLYEDRYLAWAEFVESDQRLFGALFSSDKPQVVKRGVGDIVPMIEPGDIGVICVLDDSEDALIPTQGASPRRRIRLVGTGAGRFQIQRILHNGYGDGSLPFIVVEAILLSDDHSPFANNEELVNLERNLKDKAIKMKADSNDEESLDNKGFCTDFSEDLVERLIAKLYRTTPTDRMLEEMKAELKSFSVASALMSDSSSKDRLEMLRISSTRGRLSVLDEAYLRKGWSFWGA